MRRFLMLFTLSLLVNFMYATSGVEISSKKAITEVKADNYSESEGGALYTISCANDNASFFADRPGVHKPYRASSDYYTTICPDDASKGTRISFQQFSFEKFDRLDIYDEARRSDPVFNRQAAIDKINAEVEDQEWRDKMIMELGEDTQPDSDDLVGSFTRRGSPGTITSKKGCLTFRLVSDDTVEESGFYGRITCANLPYVDPCKDFNKLVDSDLKCGVKIVDNNIRGANNYEVYGDCTMPGWPANGRELIYRFVNHKRSDLTFTFNEYNGNQPKKLNMFILNDCDPNDCVDAISRPAPNGGQTQNQVTIQNAAVGTYYVVIDGNRPYASHQYDLLVECAGGDYTTCSDPYYYDDFEAHHNDEGTHGADHDHQVDYHVGDYISTANPFWTKGNNRDARISGDRASNGTQSLEFNRADEGIQNVYLNLGGKFKGVYRICWNMYISDQNTAFFALFGGDNSDPWGAISKEFERGNSYTGRWFDVELFVDLDKNKYTLFLDNRSKSYSGAYYLNLEQLNFYGLPRAHFYVDHLCYGPVSKIPSAPSAKLGSLEPVLAVQAEMEKYGLIPVFTDNEEKNNSFGLSTSTVKFNELQAVPNPTRGMTQITLNLEQEQNINLQLFSHTGQLVRTISVGRTAAINTSIDLSNLANGMYILRAAGEQKVITKKIILQQ